MPRYFVDSIPEDGHVILSGEDAHHIGFSLRMAAGEKISVCDLSRERSYEAAIVSISKDTVSCRIVRELETNGEMPCRVTLYQALPKADKMEQIIQKSVECGVWRIRPFESARSVVRLKNVDFEKKASRWQKISLEAAKQCGRSLIPDVLEPLKFEAAIQDMSSQAYDLILCCYEGNSVENAKNVLNETNNANNIAVVIGSEGGFDPAEIEKIRSAGARIVNIGPRIFRTETASSVMLSMLSYHFEL